MSWETFVYVAIAVLLSPFLVLFAGVLLSLPQIFLFLIVGLWQVARDLWKELFFRKPL